MQKEFNKLTQDKQRKFIIKNLLKDDYFKEFHDRFKNIFVENIYSKSKLKELTQKRNEYVNNKISKLLSKYRENVLDLYICPNSKYYHDLVSKQKNKICELANIDVLSYKDEFGFKIGELIIDTWNDTKNFLINQELSLDFIAKNIQV